MNSRKAPQFWGSILCSVLILGSVIPAHVLAVDYESSNFILRDPVISIEGGTSTSTSFQYFSSSAQTATGKSTSSSFAYRAGFLYFPVATSPTLTATAGDGEVVLTWTAASATLANITDYEVGTSTSSGGPYTYESVGNVLAFTKTSLTNGTAYYFKVRAEAGILVLSKSSEATATPASEGGGGGGGGGGAPPILPPPAVGKGEIVIEGKAYPNALLAILRGGVVQIIIKVGQDATFSKTLPEVPAGTSTVSLWAEDTKGRKSITLSFTVPVLNASTTTISNIFLPPTLDAPNTVNRGDILPIGGHAFPQDRVSILVTSREVVKETNSSEEGVWQYNFDTSVLERGTHFVRAKAIGGGQESSFGSIRAFSVLAPSSEVCGNADLNGDGEVNLIDFSIMMFWWHGSNACADQNSDGAVNIIDFSILLFWWTD